MFSTLTQCIMTCLQFNKLLFFCLVNVGYRFAGSIVSLRWMVMIKRCVVWHLFTHELLGKFAKLGQNQRNPVELCEEMFGSAATSYKKDVGLVVLVMFSVYMGNVDLWNDISVPQFDCFQPNFCEMLTSQFLLWKSSNDQPIPAPAQRIQVWELRKDSKDEVEPSRWKMWIPILLTSSLLGDLAVLLRPFWGKLGGQARSVDPMGQHPYISALKLIVYI